MSSEPSVRRQMLEDSWRVQLEKTQADYDKAHDRYRRLLEEHPDGTVHNRDGAVVRARQAESEALAEYARVLRDFTNLSVDGKIPEEEPLDADGA